MRRSILFALVAGPPFYILCVLVGTASSADYQSGSEAQVCADILQLAAMPTGKEIEARHSEIIIALIHAHTLPEESRRWVQDCLAAHQVDIRVASQSDLIHLIALIVHAGNVRLEDVQFPKEFPRGKEFLDAAFKK